MVWIKGHEGITDNEIVDKLAKDAAERGDQTHLFKIPRDDFFPLIKIKMKKSWQIKYKNSPKGMNYKKLQDQVSFTPWFKNVTNKNFVRTICRIRSNHALYPQYKAKLGMSDSPLCICNEIADLQHILLECILESLNIDALYIDLLRENTPLPAIRGCKRQISSSPISEELVNPQCKIGYR
ncbi:hypothetical protein NQ317_003952, partial [Molorchus minor]